MALGTRIRYYREKAGLTLEQLSDRSGVEVGTISAHETQDLDVAALMDALPQQTAH